MWDTGGDASVNYPPNTSIYSGFPSLLAGNPSRKRALHRDGYTCRRCGAGATTVHHADGYEQPYQLDGLVSLCAQCHGSLHAAAQRTRKA